MLITETYRGVEMTHVTCLSSTYMRLGSRDPVVPLTWIGLDDPAMTKARRYVDVYRATLEPYRLAEERAK